MSTYRTDWKEDRAKCHDLAPKLGLSVSHYNPGGGTKVRIHEGVDKDWFDSHCLLATDGRPGGWMQARIFLEGFEAAVKMAARKLVPDAEV